LFEHFLLIYFSLIQVKFFIVILNHWRVSFQVLWTFISFIMTMILEWALSGREKHWFSIFHSLNLFFDVYLMLIFSMFRQRHR
jgi:hypothetical protein